MTILNSVSFSFLLFTALLRVLPVLWLLVVVSRSSQITWHTLIVSLHMFIQESGTCLVLAGVVCRVFAGPGPKHTAHPHCSAPLSFEVSSPSYAPVVDKVKQSSRTPAAVKRSGEEQENGVVAWHRLITLWLKRLANMYGTLWIHKQARGGG